MSDTTVKGDFKDEPGNNSIIQRAQEKRIVISKYRILVSHLVTISEGLERNFT